MSGETVLVTGGTGYLARWCIRLLLERGYDVHTTVRDQSAEAGLRSLVSPDGGPGRLRAFPVDLLRDDGWKQAADSCEYVLHVASPFPPAQPRDPDELIVPARAGTLRLPGAAALGQRRGHRPHRPAERHQPRRDHRPPARPPPHVLAADHRASGHRLDAGQPPPRPAPSL